VPDRLAFGWSPELIAGRLACQEGRKVISRETIYRFVYAQLKRTNDTTWRLYLPRAKIKRGWAPKADGQELTENHQSTSAPPTSPSGKHRATWKPTACSSPHQDQES
jgi:IS30 family transposase